MTDKKSFSEPQNKSDSFKHGELRQAVLSAIGIGILLGGTFLVTPNFPIIFTSIVSLIQEL